MDGESEERDEAIGKTFDALSYLARASQVQIIPRNVLERKASHQKPRHLLFNVVAAFRIPASRTEIRRRELDFG